MCRQLSTPTDLKGRLLVESHPLAALLHCNLWGLQAARQSHLDQEEAQAEAKRKAEEEVKAKQQEAAGEAAQSPAAKVAGGGASEATAASAAAVPAAQEGAAGTSGRADSSSGQSPPAAAAIQGGDQPGSSSEAGPSNALSLVQEFESDPGKHVPGISTFECNCMCACEWRQLLPYIVDCEPAHCCRIIGCFRFACHVAHLQCALLQKTRGNTSMSCQVTCCGSCHACWGRRAYPWARRTDWAASSACWWSWARNTSSSCCWSCSRS